MNTLLRIPVALLAAAVVLPVSAMPVMGVAAGQVMYAKGKSAKATVPRLLLSDVHEALSGSHLYDDTCLVFRVNNCDVFIFADEDECLRHILIRYAARGGAREKRRAAAEKVQKELQLALGASAPTQVMDSGDGTMLMYSEPNMAYSKAMVCGADRCRAIDELLALREEATLSLKRADAMSLTLELACAEDLAPTITLDLTRPVVEYIEMRASDKCSKKKLNAKVLALFADIKQYKAEDRYSSFGSGEQAVETWWTDGIYYLARNKRLYLVGTPKTLNKAVDAGVEYKQSAVELPDAAAYNVELPQGAITPVAPETEEDSGFEEEAQKTLTPKEARKAYIKLLKNL